MLALDLLRVTFARLGLIRVDMARVRAPIIRIETRNVKRLQQGFELQKHLVLATPKNIGQHLATAMINGMPQPPLVFLASNGDVLIQLIL